MLEGLWGHIKRWVQWLLGLVLVTAGVWQAPNIKQFLLPAPEAAPATMPEPELSAQQTASLIERAEPRTKDSFGWANDLQNALEAHHLERSRANTCSVIAIAAQESSFVANPTVPNLGKIAVQAVIAKLDKIPLLGGQGKAWLETHPTRNRSYMNELRQAKTERDLDLTYREIVSNLMKSKPGEFLLNNPLMRNTIEGFDQINTIGSMQVSVSFAVQSEEASIKRALTLDEVWALRDRMYTREGGIYYGALQLLGYASGYDQKIYRFADFNAGRYSSRNAAFQAMLSSLLGRKLATDGDLLIYGKNGKPAAARSEGEQAVDDVAQKYQLGLSAWKIHADLLQEKTLGFNNTLTCQRIIQQYQKVTGRKPMYAQVPGIELHSVKTSRILSTQAFANSVERRYQKCMAQP